MVCIQCQAGAPAPSQERPPHPLHSEGCHTGAAVVRQGSVSQVSMPQNLASKEEFTLTDTQLDPQDSIMYPPSGHGGPVTCQQVHRARGKHRPPLQLWQRTGGSTPLLMLG